MHYPPCKIPLGSILEMKTNENPDKIFFHFEDETYTYTDTNGMANLIANAYSQLGVKKGDEVVVILPNCSANIFNWFGMAKLGAVGAPINIAYKGDLLKHVINISDAKVILIREEYIDNLIRIQNDLSNIEHVVVISPSGRMPEAKARFSTIAFDDFIKQSREFSAIEEIRYSDPLEIIYTSGTTGPSKGVVLSHNAVYQYGMDAIESMGFHGRDIHFSCLPLYHINIRFVTMVPALLNGTTFAVVERFSAGGFWDQIRKYNATNFCLLGAMVNFILKQPRSDRDKDNPARLFWGGPMTVAQAKEFQERFNLNVFLGYFGMTEANWITSLSHKDCDELKSQGYWEQAIGMGKENKERYEVKLVDDFDNEVPVGQAGEIICRPTRPFSMMTRYINMPEQTLEAFRNLWFHTGDMARKDENGFFYFVDRKKDYIRRRGENISSYEVEASVNANVKVAESAAIGIESPLGEEEILIVVRLKESESLSAGELYTWCEDRMAKFMIPKYMTIVDEIPKTATGRTQKYKLRESIDIKNVAELH